MRYREIEPCRALRPYVRCYWELQGFPSSTETIFPDACTELVFHFDNPFMRDGVLQDRGLFVGQMTGPTTLAASGMVDCFGVRFEPAGVWSLLHIPQSRLCGHIISAADVLGCAFQRRILGTDKTADRIRLIENLFIPRVSSEVEVWSTAVSTTLSGQLSLASLRCGAGIGTRQFERRFLETVGLSPRLFEKLARFRRALHSKGAWSDIAAACGYYDQSHLIRDFRRFAGASPTAIRPDPFVMSQSSNTPLSDFG